MSTRPRDDEPTDESLDDEALSWAGDEERGGIAPRRAGPASADGAIEGRPEDEATDAAEAGDASVVPRSAARSLATVVFAVVYLAIVLGWVLSVQRTASGSSDLFVELSWQFGEFLAMISGVLFFGAVLSLTRESSTLLRVGWWALGALLLVPWPLVLVILAEASA